MEGSPCAKGQPFSRATNMAGGVRPTKGALSLHHTPPSPTFGHLSGHRPLCPILPYLATRIGHSHNHHHNGPLTS